MELTEPPAPALARGLELLEQLARDGQQPLEQLAGRNQWPKSSVLRCLHTLEGLGAAQQDPKTRHWRALSCLVTLSPPEIGALRQAAADLPRLAEQTGHCAELYRIRESVVELTDRADPEGSEIVVRARIGSRRDLLELDATSTLVYAHTDLPRPEELWFWEDGDPRPAPRDQQERMMQRALETGLSTDHAFNQHGIRRFAVPLFHEQSLAGILAIAQRLTPRFRADADRIQSVLHSLHRKSEIPAPDVQLSPS